MADPIYNLIISEVPDKIRQAQSPVDRPHVQAWVDSVSRAATGDVQRGLLGLNDAMRLYSELNRINRVLGTRSTDYRNLVYAAQQRRRRVRTPR